MPAEIETILRDQEVVKALAGLITAVLLALAGLLTLGVNKLRKIAALSEITKEQVTNSHGTNLRDDFDSLKESIESGFRRMDHQFGEMHDRQMVTDRRIEGVEANARTEHDRIWKALDQNPPKSP